MRVTILGCGTSTGVPRIGHDWGACDPAEPRNWRRRSSIMVEEGDTRILIDTSPDLRMQLLDARVSSVTGVIWTHDHADQTHGIDDLRTLAQVQKRQVPCYSNARTFETLHRRFGYCFETPPGGFYPPIITSHEIHAGRPFEIGGLTIEPFEQDHGFGVISLGLRFGDFAYSNDVVQLSETAFEVLAGVKTWVVDAMRYTEHPTHSHVARTLGWIERLRPQRAVLTNLHIALDYQKLKSEVPVGVEPAYDGMVLEI